MSLNPRLLIRSSTCASTSMRSTCGSHEWRCDTVVSVRQLRLYGRNYYETKERISGLKVWSCSVFATSHADTFPDVTEKLPLKAESWC